MRRLSVALPALLVLAVASCRRPTDGEGWPRIEFRGRVTTPAGAPARDAQIVVRLYRLEEPFKAGGGGACSSTAWARAEGRTNRHGNYRIDMSDPAGEFRGCVEVFTGSPIQGFVGTSTRREGVVLKGLELGGSPLVVDFQLLPAAQGSLTAH